MSRLRIELRKLMDRMDELSLRERGMVFLGVLALMYIGTVHLVIQPLTQQRARLEQELKTKRDQIQSVERQIQALLTGDTNEGDAGKRAHLAALREQANTLDAELGKTTSGLVTPKDMARLTDQYLSRKRGLAVIKVESLPAEPLLLEAPKVAPPGGAGAVANAPIAGAQLYKHGMRIELRGSYLDMLGYLQGLEAMPWKVFWGQALLQTETYPVSKLTLVIYTLSTKEGWIGI